MASTVAHSAVHDLVALLRDGEKGFRELGERVQDAACREFLLEESVVRSAYAAELERAMRRVAAEEVHESGTALGSMHRQWIDLKAALGAGDRDLLGSTELCEWFAMRAYQEALEDPTLPPEIHAVIVEQAKGVRRSRDMVQEFRRGTRG